MWYVLYILIASYEDTMSIVYIYIYRIHRWIL